MELNAIKNSSKIHDVIWTYNLCSIGVNEDEWQKAELILSNLLDEVIRCKRTITERQIKDFFAQTVSELERLFAISPLDYEGVYDYGGLNEFFADIMEALKFPVTKGQFALISDFVYNEDSGE